MMFMNLIDVIFGEGIFKDSNFGFERTHFVNLMLLFYYLNDKFINTHMHLNK